MSLSSEGSHKKWNRIDLKNNVLIDASKGYEFSGSNSAHVRIFFIVSVCYHAIIPVLLQTTSFSIYQAQGFLVPRFPGYLSFWPIRTSHNYLIVTKNKERSVNSADSERREGI